MKTERMTLLISPADKAAITARAEGLGLSVSELVRTAALDFDPDEAAARAEVEALLPEFRASISNMHASFERMIARLDEGERRRDEMETPEYRTHIQQQLMDDPTIDWERVRMVFETSTRKAA
jgi:hypothetical protein